MSRQLPLISVIVLVSLSLDIYTFWPEKWWGHDLVANLLAGSVDVLFTVTILSWAISEGERDKTRAARFGAYLQCCNLVGTFSSLWFDMVKATAKTAPPTGADLFSEEYLATLTGFLDLDADCGQLPQRTWENRLVNYNMEVANLIATILQRWHNVLTPEVLSLVIGFERIPFNRIYMSIPTIRANQRVVNLPADNGLFIVEGFQSDELPILIALRQALFQLSSEFQNLHGFRLPPDITFENDIATLQMRDDIAPKMGSARLTERTRRIGQRD